MSDSQFRILVWALIQIAHLIRISLSGHHGHLTAQANKFEDEIKTRTQNIGIVPFE